MCLCDGEGRVSVSEDADDEESPIVESCWNGR